MNEYLTSFKVAKYQPAADEGLPEESNGTVGGPTTPPVPTDVGPTNKGGNFWGDLLQPHHQQKEAEQEASLGRGKRRASKKVTHQTNVF